MRSVEARESEILWQPQASGLWLDNISAGEIAHFLNTEYVFDFDYEPGENDMLRLHFVYTYREIKGKSRPYAATFISFLFQGEKWIVNQGYDHISLDFELFRKGKAQVWIDGKRQ